jgi:hypothetical protein
MAGGSGGAGGAQGHPLLGAGVCGGDGRAKGFPRRTARMSLSYLVSLAIGYREMRVYRKVLNIFNEYILKPQSPQGIK